MFSKYFSDLSTLKSCYNEASNEYYIERNPQAFSAIINYYRCGKLHMPKVNFSAAPSGGYVEHVIHNIR